ncbi:hypothetical protein FRC11_002035, partial [Ceratobasidium sp. 423]
MPLKCGPPDSNTKSSKAPKPAGCLTHRRGHHRANSQTETTLRFTTPLPKHVFCPTPPRPGQADTSTPRHRSAAGAPCVSSKTNNASYTHQSHHSTTAAPKPQKQDTMHIQIKEELCDMIFHDPKFIEWFLS